MELLSEEFNKAARDINRSSGGFVKMNMTPGKGHSSPSPNAPEEPDIEFSTFNFECCGEVIKHDGSASQLSCVICGKQHAV